MSNLIGQSLGRYHILEQLGEGGMATVYKAFDTRLEREVAIKIIRRGAFPPDRLENMLKRFEREAKSLAKLSHPNIVKVLDFGEHENAPYLVMEYFPGGTLKQRLGKPMLWQDAVRLILPIAEALEYAHEQKIIHRDIKPSNILLTQKGQPMLTDFGIAKILESEETFTLTGTGIGVGTPEYMAPEQWTGQTTSQSDIYSLGIVLYEMVTGRKPYMADTPAALLLKQANDPLPKPSLYAHDLPEKVEKLLLKVLAKNHINRYAGMGEFAAALESVLSVSPVPAEWLAILMLPNKHLPAKERSQASSIKIGAIITGIIALFCILAFTGFAIQSRSAQHAEQTAVARLAATEVARQAAVTEAARQATATEFARQATVTEATRQATATEFARQATATTQARQEYVANIESRSKLIFGPMDGKLSHNADNSTIADYNSNVNLKDFVVEAFFSNPFEISAGTWDYGYLFRHEGFNKHYRLIISSTEKWELKNNTGTSDGEIIQQGIISNLNTIIGGTNSVKLIGSGNKGFLYINNVFIAELDLSARTNSGYIRIATGMYSGHEINSYSTGYKDFTIWSVQ